MSETGPAIAVETSTAVMETRQLSYSLPHFRLQAINLQVERGELLAVLGPNASGKSTLLRLLAGVLEPDAGAALLDGEPIRSLDRRERARRVAVVQQESPVLFPIDVLSFVLQGRHARRPRFGFESDEDIRVAGESLALTKADHLRGRRLQEISGGEKQRVVLARALAQEPDLLLLDEPTLHLDIGFQVELLELIRRLARERNYAVVLVSHELNLVAEFADRAILLHRGEMLAQGTPGEVYRADLLEQVFQTRLDVTRDPESGRPRVHVRSRGA